MKRLVVFGISLVLLAASSQARRLEQATEKVEMEGAGEIVLRCDLGAGEFSIAPGDIDEAAVIEVSYDPRYVDYFVGSEVKRGKCYVELESEHHRSSEVNTEKNVWDITLSTKYPASIEMDVGACDANFELGGLRIKELSLDIGAAAGVLAFSQPNRERLGEFDVDAGASSLDMQMLGNANFEFFNFDGGAGSFDLDFRGQYNGESEIDIDIGLGSADIILPKGVPVRIETDGSNWLSSVDLHDDDLDMVDDDVYESEDFDSSDTRILVRLSVGLGSVDIYWKK